MSSNKSLAQVAAEEIGGLVKDGVSESLSFVADFGKAIGSFFVFDSPSEVKSNTTSQHNCACEDKKK